MKLEKWALIAEIVGAAAVVMSLLYVGYQIQLSTSERRDASIQAITSRDEQIAFIYATDEAARDAWFKVLRGEEFTETDRKVMGAMIFAHLRVLEDAYNKYREGYLDDEFMSSRMTLVRGALLSSSQLRIIYDIQRRAGLFPRPFIDWFDESLNEPESEFGAIPEFTYDDE